MPAVLIEQPNYGGAELRLYYDIRRVAQTLGEPEELLRELAMEMQPEDGCLTVQGVGDQATTAFTRDGLEYLRELLAEHSKRPTRRTARHA